MIKLASIKLITAEDIRRLRQIMGLTQKELAIKAGVSQSLIARIENKNIDPRLSTVRKIIDALAHAKENRIAADIMHHPVITIDAKDSVKIAGDLMEKHSISQMPVLEDNRIVGGIREATIIDCIIRRSNPEKIFSGTVYSIMERRFPTVSPATSVEEVVYMLSQDQPAVLVMNNDNKLVGIITKIDVISSAISFKRDERGSQ